MDHLEQTYKRSRIPLYLQVAATLRRRIEDGQWEAGHKIPTLEELEEEFQVARVTVRQAIDLLQKEGLVWRQQGKGTFVSRELIDKRWLRLRQDLSSLVASIEGNVPRFIPVKDPPALPRLDPGDGTLAANYHYLRSVQYRDGDPFGIVSIHLERSIYERHREAFHAQAALPILSRLDGELIGRAHQTMVIGSADTEAAHLLRVALNAPTAECHCVVTDRQDVAIYVAEIVYRGDCVRLDVDLLRNDRHE